MTVLEYVARFTELARFADDYVATNMAKVRRFENGLKLSIRSRIVGLRLHDMDSIIGRTLTIEREIEDAWNTRDAGILFTVDLRVMDMSEFDVILGMDWLTTYRVVIDYERRRVTAYTQKDTHVVFQGDKNDIFLQTVYESRCQGQLVGWLASLTLEDEVRPDLDLPRVVCEYEYVFPDELPGLPL